MIVCQRNFRDVDSNKFPDCCFVCKFADVEYDWEICCNHEHKNIGEYSKIWTTCNLFERCDLNIFYRQR
ncbi:hypothetical protein M0R19_05920 [Candidatus Pacearchaeota archaeon]|jgi:hypothetical protein|nr:hypothetical protein [Candidatus Pacearchaeota archaeon]